MKSNDLNINLGLNTLTLNNDQANSLLDLITDQIHRQRVYLRTTPLNRTNITALTHFRNLKRLILNKEREAMRQEDNEQGGESEQFYDFFTIGVKEAERRKAI